MSTVLGTITIRAGGQFINSNKGARVKLGGSTAEVRKTSRGVEGHSFSPEESMVECSIPVSEGVDLEALRSLRNVPVTLVTDSGQQYGSPSMTRTDASEFDDESGNMSITLTGQPFEAI